jgi:hypothetical protein
MLVRHFSVRSCREELGSSRCGGVTTDARRRLGTIEHTDSHTHCSASPLKRFTQRSCEGDKRGGSGDWRGPDRTEDPWPPRNLASHTWKGGGGGGALRALRSTEPDSDGMWSPTSWQQQFGNNRQTLDEAWTICNVAMAILWARPTSRVLFARAKIQNG